MEVVFIQTGGTIDKDYPHTTKGWAFEFGEPACNRILEKLNPSFEFKVITSCQKDSLEITNSDRKVLSEMIINNPSVKFIVTHGTDTMLETGKYLQDTIKDKLIIITGAMRPERFSNSEASINVGAAIGAANILTSGIYISMHGVVKSVNEISRDLKTGKYF